MMGVWEEAGREGKEVLLGEGDCTSSGCLRLGRHYYEFDFGYVLMGFNDLEV